MAPRPTPGMKPLKMPEPPPRSWSGWRSPSKPLKSPITLTRSAFVNNEDGKLYRWDLVTGTLADEVVLTAGIGEAYTPTIIGPDGTIYAINDATLFAVDEGP